MKKETKSILHLVLKRKWYEMIEKGVKTEEYREVKPYWETRLMWKGLGYMKKFDFACFSLGYTSTTMTFKIKHIIVGYGNPEWGAPTDREVFIIRLGERIG